MKKLFSLTLLAIILSVGSFAQTTTIMGTFSTCVGSTAYVSVDSTVPGGTWSSSSTAIASVLSSGFYGVVTGVSAGICDITYLVGGVANVHTFTVSGTPPASITGATSFCVGSSITLTDATAGGTWSSAGSGIASISSTTGVTTGVSAGTVTISYTLPSGCFRAATVTVSGSPAVDSIIGATSLCVGSTTTLTDITSGGVWTTSSSAVATVSGGTVTGIAAGTVTISYTVTGACGTTTRTHTMFITSTTSPGAIAGTFTEAVGANTTLTDVVSGGTWSSSNTSIATVGASSGLVHGVAAGVVTISYTVTGCSGSASATATFTVTAAPPVNRISGYINFGSGSVDSFSTIKVWLITYNPADSLLGAVDSTVTYSGGASAYYQFMGEPTDSYRVKAAYLPATLPSTGYIPTYHTASFYWNTADVIYHTTSSANDGEDINMAYGTTTSGTGFIGGNVYLGANRGTSGSIPSVGLLVAAMSASGTIYQQSYTDAAGHYSFSNLPVGSYTIYPELLNYRTTPYASVSITAAAPTVSAANFTQHTVSHTITPSTTAVQSLSSQVASVVVFPNPTSGKLNIIWNAATSEKANLTVTDMAGNVVYTTALNMTQGSGNSQFDMSFLANGMYLVSVKSGTMNYNNKIVLQH